MGLLYNRIYLFMNYLPLLIYHVLTYPFTILCFFTYTNQKIYLQTKPLQPLVTQSALPPNTLIINEDVAGSFPTKQMQLRMLRSSKNTSMLKFG